MAQILTDSPSISIKVQLGPVFCLKLISNGPAPWAILTPVLITRSNAKVISLLNAINSNWPSSNFCLYYAPTRPESVDLLVIHTLRSPHMQLVQLRQTRPLQPYFSLNVFQFYPSFSFLKQVGYEPLPSLIFWVFASDQNLLTYLKESMTCQMLCMLLKKFLAPTSVYNNLVMKALEPLFFSTLYTTRASSPMPKQFVNDLLSTFSSFFTSTWFFISQKHPYSQTSISISQISQCPIVALFHFPTIACRPAMSKELKSRVLQPQPMDREKSFPVPIGRIPIVTFLKSISACWAQCRTHGIVPSPPQIINLTLLTNCPSSLISSLLCLASLKPLAVLAWSNMSKDQMYAS